MKWAITFAALTLTLVAAARAEITTGTVEYKDGDTTLKGYYAHPANQSNTAPGVLVIHEWWGLNDYVKSRCRQLAELGYVAFAADIYGDGFVTTDPKVAEQHMLEAKKNGWLRSRGKLALQEMRKDEGIDQNNIAIIGYCFGGTTALEMARAGEDVKGVVSFHGGLQTDQPAQKGQVKPRVLILTGEADPLVPKEQVQAAEKEFKDAGADVKVVGYPGAKHAFTNPQADQFKMPPIGYNKEADEKSWQAMKAFFAEIFGAANPKP
jgi:dienelactone hydrolase